MKTLFRNFSHTFRRFFTASLLNIIGLSIAFASFFVIMTQVDYDWNFNKSFKEHERIFRIEANAGAEWGWTLWIPRPLCELIGNSSPHIRAYSIQDAWASSNSEFEVDGKIFKETLQYGFGDYLKVFQPTMLSGSTAALEEPGKALISRSMAERFFGSVDAVGKTIFIDRQVRNRPLVIGGVYEDMPQNTQLGNCVFATNRDIENLNSWGNWNYLFYIRTDGTLTADELQSSLQAYLNKNLPKEFKKEVSDEPDMLSNLVHFTPLDEVHFSKTGNKTAASTGILYLLICVSILIALTATINYMNFSLAETPMRIRSINTQKVLGARVGILRFNLIAESVIICACSFLLGMLWVFLLKDTGLNELVAANISPLKHPVLVSTTFALSILMGMLAGTYPSYYVTSFPPALALKGSFGLSPKGKLLRSALVCFQFLVSFVLIIAVAIMYLQSHYIRHSEYGYDKSAIAITNLPVEAFGQTEAIIGELTSLSGVESAGTSQFLLSTQDTYMRWGRGEGDYNISFTCMPVDWHYLSTMGIKITDGRNFKPGDKDVYIFNEAARQKYKWMGVDKPATPGYTTPVIGFCENIKFSSFRNDDVSEPLAFYLPPESWDNNWKNFLNVRIAPGTDKVEVIQTMNKVMEKFSPGRDISFRFLDEAIDRNYRNEQRFTKQILLFSLIAIAISMIGVFGLTMFESEYRRKEIGIRKIMGSSTSKILYMFSRRYLLMLTGCFVVATPVGAAIGLHWLESFAEKTPVGPWIFLAAYLLVGLITMTTVLFQSWRNANENPIHSIRTE